MHGGTCPRRTSPCGNIARSHPLPKEGEQVGGGGTRKALRELGENEEVVGRKPFPPLDEVSSELGEHGVTAAEAGEAVVERHPEDSTGRDVDAHRPTPHERRSACSMSRESASSRNGLVR